VPNDPDAPLLPRGVPFMARRPPRCWRSSEVLVDDLLEPHSRRGVVTVFELGNVLIRVLEQQRVGLTRLVAM
jgi:hypothetical protein